MTNQKMELTAQSLVERLNLRLATAADPVPAAKSFTPDGAGGQDTVVTLTFGAGNNSIKAIVRFATYPAPASGALDGLGLPQRVYSPHIAKVIFDRNVAGVTYTQKFALLGELFRVGMRVELYTKDGGAGVIAIADIAAAQFDSAFESLEWAGLASV
jgi:hypothetical protein